MREKKKTMIETQASKATKRQNVLTRLNDGVGPLREKLRTAEAGSPVMNPDPKHLLAELEGDVDNSLYCRWPIIIQSKAEDVSKMTNEMNDSMENLDTIIAGYEKKFGLVVDQQSGGKKARTEDDSAIVPHSNSAAGEDETVAIDNCSIST
jgi:hypothetical protein